MIRSPVALLVYNRPETTRRVLAAVAKAKPPRLLVVADGPKPSDKDRDRCEEVRSIFERLTWDCEVFTNFSDSNLGCKRRVWSGLDWIFEREAEAIILEDDCLPSQSFFGFCDSMLDRYRSREEVMMISGTNYLGDRLGADTSYFFSRYFAVWGWAGWRRAWSAYDPFMRQWPEIKSSGRLRRWFPQPFMRRYLTRRFDLAHEGKVNTWDMQWFFSCLVNGGVALVPQRNLISNIGLEGTHTSSDRKNHNMPIYGLNVKSLVHPERVEVNQDYDLAVFEEQFRLSKLEEVKEIIGPVTAPILARIRARKYR